MLVRTVLIGVLALSAANAQPPGPARGHGRFGGASGPILDGGARFLGAEPGRPGRVVRNAPYSGDVVTETTQLLADGNRIRQLSTVHVARDSEGRTRSEQTLRNLGGLAPNANLPQVVFINDPVAKVNYALNSTAHTAAKSAWNPSSTPARPTMRRPPSDAAPNNSAADLRQTPTANPNLKTESLGRQTIEGVAADGTRITQTIPAGEIGNEQPIQIVSETWYSPDLQTVLLAKRSDPRSGETTTRLTNVNRAEPAHALFEVPADYKVTETAGRFGRPAGQ